MLRGDTAADLAAAAEAQQAARVAAALAPLPGSATATTERIAMENRKYPTYPRSALNLRRDTFPKLMKLGCI